ncbi:MAG: Gfo/Idh/MocA family oxidoreductase [Candidatus Hydrogenedentes bacterium]|nr:Gfo/Idh/MocA family oxidoreductase [Candidatus Hydrogenedentota bacterium]
MKKQTENTGFSRRSFLFSATAGIGAASIPFSSTAEDKIMQGFDQTDTTIQEGVVWKPVSDRKIRLGIAGYGVCKFGGSFGFQNHPNIDVVAVSDLIPDRCAELAKVCQCEKTYPSLEELIKDDNIDAVFIATDAPAHAWHCIQALRHGKHVGCAVPAVFGSLEDAEQLYETVKATGLKYMMFETSAFHNESYAMREIYKAGGFGKLLYAEGEYYHYSPVPIPSFRGWRVGLPPQWYPTHSNAYHTTISGGSFTEVSCMGTASTLDEFIPANNRYQNPFGTEIALFRTSEGGMARMGVSWDTPGYGGEKGRVRGEKGSMQGMDYKGIAEISGVDLNKPPLPPAMSAGGHGGSHGYLANEFVEALLENRTPLVNIAWALNMTVSGIVAHTSALKDGELLKIPQYTWA